MESKNSGEHASGVCNHTRLCPGLFVRPNPGLSRASASPFVGATTKQEATVKGVETVASGQHVIARTINERPYTTPRQ